MTSARIRESRLPIVDNVDLTNIGIRTEAVSLYVQDTGGGVRTYRIFNQFKLCAGYYTGIISTARFGLINQNFSVC
jgi:hypothetical protein